MCGVCGWCRPDSTCGRAPSHRPLAGSELQWESGPQGTSTTTQHAPLLHNRNDGTRRLVLAAHRVRSMWVVQAAFYVRTRPTTPPAGRIRTAVGEPTPRNEHHRPAQHHISTNRNDGDDATRRLVLAAPCVWGIWGLQAADNDKADAVWCGGALRARCQWRVAHMRWRWLPAAAGAAGRPSWHAAGWGLAALLAPPMLL